MIRNFSNAWNIYLCCPSGSLKDDDAPDNGDPRPRFRPSSAISEIAVNLADRKESDLRPRWENGAANETAARGGARSLWFYLTLAALGLVVGEWFLYQRRIVA